MLTEFERRVQLLQDVSLFRDFNSEVLIDLAGMLTAKHFKKGGAIYRQGEVSTNLWIIRKGEARVNLPPGDDYPYEKPSVLYGEGSYFGEVAMLTDFPVSATMEIVSLNTAVFLVLSRKRLQEFLTSHPAEALQIIEKLAKRTKVLNDVLGSKEQRF